MTPRRWKYLAAVVVLTIVAATLASLLTARELNRRSADSDHDQAETRRIVDELVCEVRGLRDVVTAEHGNNTVPRTVPRTSYDAPCPPPPREAP